MNDLFFIINGRSEKHKAIILKIEEVFKDISHKIVVTEYIGHAIAIAELAVKEGYEKIICSGGDGTLNETLNGILKAAQHLGKYPNTNIRLGIIPAGTGNDFIKTMDSPVHLSDLKTSVQQDLTQKIDVGLLEYQAVNGEKAQRWFINVVDVGLGGEVAAQLSRSSRRLGPFLTYQKAIISTLLSYRKLPVMVQGSTVNYKGNTMLCVIANAKYFGSGIGIAPDADPTNAQFSIVIAGDLSMLKYLRNIGKARKCEHLKMPEISYHESASITVTELDKKLPVDMDGEFIGYSPVKAEVIPQAICFYV
ncbi:MAG: diacylglycerol kinase family lipid kinase [Chitinophagales bacterium]|nr:diacylglycerol kinase family lipid kinase [Chitinophagales bacterium]